MNREDIVQGAEALGVPLEEHLGVVLAAMQAAAGALGLDGSRGSSTSPGAGA